jgi:hypothetical protein
VAFDIDLDEADVAAIDAVEPLHRHFDGAQARIGGGRFVRDGRTAGDHDAVHDRAAQLDRARAVGQRHRLDGDPPREFLAQDLGQTRHRLIGEHVARVASHVVHVATVVGADIDRVGVVPAEVFEQVQLDFAVAPVEARSRQFRRGCGQIARNACRASE